MKNTKLQKAELREGRGINLDFYLDNELIRKNIDNPRYNSIEGTFLLKNWLYLQDFMNEKGNVYLFQWNILPGVTLEALEHDTSCACNWDDFGVYRDGELIATAGGWTDEEINLEGLTS